jgi:hypothetical protein
MLRRVLRSNWGRLAVLLGAIALVLLASAALLHFGFDKFNTFGDSLWSSVKHLLDPSSLQDDEGAPQRAIGIFQVIAGLVLLVGLLFTVIAETLGRSIERLARYEAPVHAKDHLVAIGGIDLAPETPSTLVRVGRPEALPKRIVLLAPESARDSRDELLADLRAQAGPMQVEIVIGDTSGASGFELASVGTARDIIVFPTTSGPTPADSADVEVMQTGLALRAYLDERAGERAPNVSLLFRRGRNVDAAWELLPHEWDAVVGDRVVAAILRLAIVRPELASILPGLSNESAVRAISPRGLQGLPFGELAARIDDGIPIGLMLDDGSEVKYAPDPARKLGENDRVVVLGPGRGVTGSHPLARRPRHSDGGPLRIAMVGCGINAPALMEEFESAKQEQVEFTVLATRAAYDAYLPRHEYEGVGIEFTETRVTDPGELEKGLHGADADVILVTPSPTTYDLRASDAEATLSTLHVLRLTDAETPIVVEMFLPESVRRLPSERRLSAVSTLDMVSTAIAFSILDTKAAVALEGLFGGGVRIEAEPLDAAGATTFGEIYSSGLASGVVPIAVRSKDGAVTIAPREDARLGPGDELIILDPGLSDS